MVELRRRIGPAICAICTEVACTVVCAIQKSAPQDCRLLTLLTGLHSFVLGFVRVKRFKASLHFTAPFRRRFTSIVMVKAEEKVTEEFHELVNMSKSELQVISLPICAR